MKASSTAHGTQSESSAEGPASSSAQARPEQYSDIRELAPTTHSTPSVPDAGRGRVTNALNKGLVLAYKVVGFSLLSIILCGLCAYVALNALFFLHRRWVAPAIIAPSDSRVLELRARLAHEVYNREKVEAERAQVRSDLSHARRTIEAERRYQETFRKAVSRSASFQRGRVAQVRALGKELDVVQQHLDQATRRFAEAQQQALSSAYEARLINREQKATGDYRIAELGTKQITLQGQKAGINAELAELSQELQALGTVAKNPQESSPGTVEGLELKRNFMNSVLEEQKAREDIGALEKAEAALAETTKGYDNVIAIIKESPLLLAASGELTVAFVPYDNLPNVKAGDPVFGCQAYVVWCERVGSVGATIEGEVVAKHPVYGSDMRGKFVRLELDDPSWARHAVLHVGRAPLLL